MLRTSALLAPLLLAPGVAADVLELPAAADASLYQDDLGSVANGSGQHLFAGSNSQGNVRRALLRFDPAAALPPGATVTGVTLELHMSQTNAPLGSYSLHRVLTAWGEGPSDPGGGEGSGAPSSAGDATWIHTVFPAQLWASPGGDFAAGASASADVDGPGTYAWSSPGLVADVQDMLDDPAADHGWILVSDVELASTAKRFDSRENPDPLLRPVLRVEFTPPCAATGFCSSNPNSTGLAATLSSSGSCVVADNALTLSAGPVPDQQAGIFFYAAGSLNGGAGVPFGPGLLCVGGGPFHRLPVTQSVAGVLSLTPDLTAPPMPTGLIAPGSTWYFQAWFRDPAAGGAAFNLSDGLAITFQ